MVPAPRGRFVPPVLVVLGVAAYIARHQSDGFDRFEFVLIVTFVLLPGALFFVCGYAVAYLLLRRRQRAGARPRSGAAVVVLAVLGGLALLAAMLSFVMTVVPSEPAQTVTTVPVDAEPASLAAQAPPVTSAVTRDGRPFIPNTLRVWRRGEGLRLFVSDRFRSCAESIDEGQAYFDDETYLWIDLARELSRTGVLGWRFAGLHVAFGEDHDPPDRVRTIEVVGDGTPGEPTTITVAAAARTNSVPTLGAGNGSIHELVVQGPLTAIGCEVAVPTVRAQAGSLRVAGRQLPIVGAIVRPTGDVVLSSTALDCEHGPAGALTITLSSVRDTHRHITVSGEWLRESITGSSTTGGIPRAAAQRSRRGVVELGLSGSAVVEGYKVTIEGNVRAEVCRS